MRLIKQTSWLSDLTRSHKLEEQLCDSCAGKWFIPGKLSEGNGAFDDYSPSLEECLWYVSMLWLYN